MSENYVAAGDRYSEEGKLYRRCGKSGLKLSKVSLGLWHNFGTDADMDTMKSLLFTAFDHGITHFDLGCGGDKFRKDHELGSSPIS